MATLKELESKLDLKQRKAALMLVENELNTEEKKTQDEIAAELGITRQGLYKWRTQNKAFIEYRNKLADDFLSSMRPLVYKQLMGLITGSQPSIKAIDLFMRRFALLTDKQQVEEIGQATARTSKELEDSIREIDEALGGVDGLDEE
jgi:DNA-binding XRE family transcriptional regulator